MDRHTEEHYLDADDDLLNYLEMHGENCIKEIFQSNALNKDAAQKLLSILIVGIGSSFLLLTQKETPAYLYSGLAMFTVYWSLCAAYLVVRVLGVRKRMLGCSRPYDLYHDGYKGFTDGDYAFFESHGYTGKRNTLSILRRYRLRGLDGIASVAKKENERLGRELERVRIATILTPILSTIVSVITYVFS
ncbi:hypothetical protein EXW94_18170 [Enterobacter sp. JMULE2]|uniref:hypothetical protein n=1 Tax=Enterobacter sp. JMULE2 TaxID=2518340 RepID=UPI001575102D|nr:hypothetical protein [Enterobacter sp. JMULE2]NTZ36186.1 hypothetical protein [Enterobacter sp. JMULE2]NTZ39591.1 hypothetical protein [Enterobacter sp. JMULE2]